MISPKCCRQYRDTLGVILDLNVRFKGCSDDFYGELLSCFESSNGRWCRVMYLCLFPFLDETHSSTSPRGWRTPDNTLAPIWSSCSLETRGERGREGRMERKREREREREI